MPQKPEIRKFLTVSASHLPPGFADRLRDQATNGRGLGREHSLWPFSGEYGFFVYAPGEADIEEDADEADIPDSVARILFYARSLGCSFVLFDVDGDVIEGFETLDEAGDLQTEG